ncbi:MAG: hypothetical protein K5839_05915 [Treponemataceae bacterium]|nr:hypothetical protein [Treponemataceae bacterium]
MKNTERSRQVKLIILSVYELIRALMILAIPAVNENALAGFPLSWYYSVPLLILPFIIIVGMIFNLEKLSKCSILLPLIKLLGTASYIGYFIKCYKDIIQQLRLNNFSPFYALFFMMIFFIIDVIIGIILFNNEKYEKKEDELCK